MSQDREKDFCFAIELPKRVYYVQGQSADDVRRWYNNLELMLQHITNARQRHSSAAATSLECAHPSTSSVTSVTSLTPIIKRQKELPSVPIKSHSTEFIKLRQTVPSTASTSLKRLTVRLRRYVYQDRKRFPFIVHLRWFMPDRLSQDAFDESIVPWQKQQQECQSCLTKFGMMDRFLKRHFCRLCGFRCVAFVRTHALQQLHLFQASVF